MSAGSCHVCGDALHEVTASAPDHGMRRQLSLMWCMGCAAVRSAFVGAPEPLPIARLTHGAAIQRAVDDYLLMERKARAWDDLRRHLMCSGMAVSVQSTLDVMDALVHPAHEPSSS